MTTGYNQQSQEKAIRHVERTTSITDSHAMYPFCSISALANINLEPNPMHHSNLTLPHLFRFVGNPLAIMKHEHIRSPFASTFWTSRRFRPRRSHGRLIQIKAEFSRQRPDSPARFSSTSPNITCTLPRLDTAM